MLGQAALNPGVIYPPELSHLQLNLPFTLGERARLELAQLRPGTGFELPSERGPKQTIVLFHVSRLLEEVNCFSPAKELAREGWLPVGACGRRGTNLYFVRATAEGLSALHLHSKGSPSLLNTQVTLQELLASKPRTDLVLRRRMMRPIVLASKRNTPTAPTRREPRSAAHARNLSLF